MQTRLTNSFITSACLISAQTLPPLPGRQAHSGPRRPPQPLPWPWGWHTGVTHLGGPGQWPACGDMPGNWGHSPGAGGGTLGGTVPVGAQGTSRHSVPIVTSCLVLATRQTGRGPSRAARCWHLTLLAPCPAEAGTGNRLASPWGLCGMGRGVQGERLPVPKCSR